MSYIEAGERRETGTAGDARRAPSAASALALAAATALSACGGGSDAAATTAADGSAPQIPQVTSPSIGTTATTTRPTVERLEGGEGNSAGHHAESGDRVRRSAYRSIQGAMRGAGKGGKDARAAVIEGLPQIPHSRRVRGDRRGAEEHRSGADADARQLRSSCSVASSARRWPRRSSTSVAIGAADVSRLAVEPGELPQTMAAWVLRDGAGGDRSRAPTRSRRSRSRSRGRSR